MVIEWLYALLTGIVSGFLNLLPSLPDISGAASQVAGYVSTVSGYASGLGGWVPLSLVGWCTGIIAAALLASFVIKGIRIIASFFLAGGGSAG